MAKKRKRIGRAQPRGSSKAGRPKKEGPRYADGRLRPAGPNARTIEVRKAMLGNDKLDITAASDPVDFAHAKGWLSDQDHQAANALHRLFRQAGFGGPRMGSGGLHEVQPSLNIDARSFAIMADEEIVEIWDAVFRDVVPPGVEDPAKAALALWSKIMAALPLDVQREVFSVCVAKSWPQWVISEASGRLLSDRQELQKARLIGGLEITRSVTRRERKRANAEAAPVIPLPAPPAAPPSGRKVEETTIYVTPTGEQVLEVVRRRRKW